MMKNDTSRISGTGRSARALPAGTPPSGHKEREHGFQEAAYVGELFAAIARHRRLFFLVFLGFVALATVATLLVPKTYTATVRLFVGGNEASGSNTNANQDNGTMLPILNALAVATSAQSTETYAALLQQADVAGRVAGDLGLNITPDRLLTRIHVKPIVNTSILELSASWRTADAAAKIANDFATVFVARQREFVQSQATTALNFLKAEMPAAERRKADTATALAAYQAKHSIIDVTAQTQSLLTHRTDLQTKADTIKLDQREARALLGSVQSQIATLPASVDNSTTAQVNPALTQLRSELADVNVQLAAARRRYTDKHPEVIALTEQRQALERQIAALPASVQSGVTVAPNPIVQTLQGQAAGYQARIAGDDAQLREVARQLAALVPVIAGLPAQSNAIANLQQQAKMAADVVAALEQKYNDALVAQTTAVSNVTVVQAATPEGAMLTPNLLINVAVAALLGLIIASTLVVLAEALERRLRDETDIERILGLSVLTQIPELEPRRQRELPWIRSMTLEALLHLCTALRLGGESSIRTLAVTSPSKGDGKSTIAFHLASVLANVQPKVLLIDADMRCPTLHRRIGESNDVGLADVLRGTRTLADSIHHISNGLDALTSGSLAETPFSLLRSSRFDELLESAREGYNTIIVDCTALVPVTDALIVGSKVDATALVISANGTDERAARYAVERLSALGIHNVVGVILNRARTAHSDYSDYFSPPPAGALPEGAA
ncbi:polysaccharide biosynthesis tyrosine autokinase [bacterium]|nr:MAG: polysaccharide biosynthesis tyrosine autokinase [bacterium]